MVQKCSICSTSLSCSSSEACWCSNFPAILPLEVGQTCLCDTCLIRKLKIQIETSERPLSEDQKSKIADLGVPDILSESIDYDINEDGLMVLSSWYLLRRGYCCGNLCKNCPYGDL